MRGRMSIKCSQVGHLFAMWFWEWDEMGGAKGGKVVIKQELMDAKMVGISAKVTAPNIIRTALEMLDYLVLDHEFIHEWHFTWIGMLSKHACSVASLRRL